MPGALAPAWASPADRLGGAVASTSGRPAAPPRRPHLLPRPPRHVPARARPLDSADEEGEQPPPGPGADALASIRRWLGERPPLVPTPDQDPPPPASPTMQINPGQSVMDIEDYFANRAALGPGAAPPTGNARLPVIPPAGYAGAQRPGGDTAALGPGPAAPGQPPEGSPGGGGGGGAAALPPRAAAALTDWSAGVREDWDEWEGTPAVADLDDNLEAAELREQVIERRRARRGRRTTVRDEYLRPIVDVTGIYNRLAIGEKEAEERVFVEAITNQYESRESLRYAAVLLGVPLAVGFAVSHAVATPLWAYAERLNPGAFALSDEQKVAGAEAMHREEVRLRLEASLGQAPPLNDEAMLNHLHQEAVRFAEGMRAYNRRAMLNAVSDSASGAALFVLLARDSSQRAILFRTIGRVFTGLSDTAKAFLIILVTDILLGYHSEEGWTAGLHLLTDHYGWHSGKEGIQVFVATVPVLLDSLFKYWIFVGLNKVDPAAAVTLRQMDRH